MRCIHSPTWPQHHKNNQNHSIIKLSMNAVKRIRKLCASVLSPRLAITSKTLLFDCSDWLLLSLTDLWYHHSVILIYSLGAIYARNSDSLSYNLLKTAPKISSGLTIVSNMAKRGISHSITTIKSEGHQCFTLV